MRILHLLYFIFLAAPPAYAAPDSDNTFVGEESCGTCHSNEVEQWRGSHHDFAMEVASAQTVLANFKGTSFEYNGVRSVFRVRGNKYYVSTDGPDGKKREYEISYVFGFYPLQQYIIKLPQGHDQVLGIAWDTRPKAEGGQHWFHLYPDQKIGHNDAVHWTKRSQNWNSQCAYCHSTNLQKNYSQKDDSYGSKWSDINVACESCHGPGSKHVDWAKTKSKSDPSMGLSTQLSSAKRAAWKFVDGKSVAVREGGEQYSKTEVNTCSPCHSRRSQIREPAAVGDEFLNNFRPALLTEGLYHADGQIQDEVYVWGSFLQSKMHEQGVTCTDCHNPHTLQLKAEGNALCSQCHQATVFDSKKHHFHEPGTEGAQCVSCHMPEKTYMVIDPRRDHSFRVPRPDLSIGSELPNACNSCHVGKSPAWAAGEVAKRHGEKERVPHYGEIFTKARNGDSGAVISLKGLLGDSKKPSIVRATAAHYLGRFNDPSIADEIRSALGDENSLVRFGAAQSLHQLTAKDGIALSNKLLNDKVRVVRLEVTPALSSILTQLAKDGSKRLVEASRKEYLESQNFNSDRAFSHLNLAVYLQATGDVNGARRSLEKAIQVEPYFVPAYINLADFYRAQRKDDQGERVLRSALLEVPDSADARHSLGLLLVRTGRLKDAVSELGQAAKLAPNNVRYSYVFAIALSQVGEAPKSVRVLEKALARAPNNTDVLLALVTINRDIGNKKVALGYAKKLQSVVPGNPDVENLIRQLK